MNSYPTDDNANRVRSVVDSLIGTEDADDIMIELMDTLTDTVTSSPSVGKYYVFVYKAKTPNIRYDAHPFVVVTGVYQWGFSGFNFHWNDYRRYSWQEVVSNLYEIYPSELNTMESVPIARFRSS